VEKTATTHRRRGRNVIRWGVQKMAEATGQAIIPHQLRRQGCHLSMTDTRNESDENVAKHPSRSRVKFLTSFNNVP
jgi:hypothetical protein